MNPMKRNLIRVVLFPLAASLALASFAFANDSDKNAENKTETTHDVSKNPLTGSTTETTTTESRMKVGSNAQKSKRVHRKKFNKEGRKIKEETESTSESQH